MLKLKKVDKDLGKIILNDLQFLTQAQKEAIHAKLNVRFNGRGNQGFRILGIIYAWQGYAGGFFPGIDRQSIGYDGRNGRIYHGCKGVIKIDKYNNGDIITIDAYLPPISFFETGINTSNIRPLITFTVNDVEQDVYVSKIPQSFRFCVSRYYERSSVDILELSVQPADKAPIVDEKLALPW
ncbi:MAG: hypothetical protein EZS28_041667 [Streblomastix strix]|uniref:B30.2/SPRY domain-containing protein n=1 Tax=Streblomastix strix TaxID=222440 RepID=A0A5J4TWG0_9EUKA|nr:MAG: hypothetical protein EZS28_041667 [Streblomastix strix]